MPLQIVPFDVRVHDRENFSCGVAPLDRYLRELATQHRRKGLSVTYVLADEVNPRHIFGYYSVSTAALQLEALSDTDRRKLPAYPIPAIRVGRLAVSVDSRGKRFGELLLQNAIKRAITAAEDIGIYAVVVDAKDDTAARFYKKYGFRPCTGSELQWYLPLGK